MSVLVAVIASMSVVVRSGWCVTVAGRCWCAGPRLLDRRGGSWQRFKAMLDRSVKVVEGVGVAVVPGMAYAPAVR